MQLRARHIGRSSDQITRQHQNRNNNTLLESRRGPFIMPSLESVIIISSLSYFIYFKQWISMSSYGSSEDEGLPVAAGQGDKLPFQYDYFLSRSIDLLLAWNESSMASQQVSAEHKDAVYLKEQASALKQIDKFRTVSIIRANAFVHTLKNTFQELAKRFAALFHPHHHHPSDELLGERLKRLRGLQDELRVLFGYLQIVLDQALSTYFTGEESFEQNVFWVLSSLYTFVADPKLLWDLLGAQAQLVNAASPHLVSLGGNYGYYQNILRSLLKRNLHLRQIFERVEAELKGGADWQQSLFIVRTISLTWGLPAESGVEEREKRDFIDCLKGLHFERTGLQGHSLYYQYIFNSLHLEYLDTHRMFKNYTQMEQNFIRVLEAARHDHQMMGFVEALELDLLPFDKRKHTPKIQKLALEIIENYIGTAKHILSETTQFPDIPPFEGKQVLASSQWILHKESANGLIDLLMRLQQGSRDAFSLGGLQVQKLYLRMIDLLKHIYLSYQHANWIFPPNLLLYIPLHNLIDIADDIRQEVKRALFTMVSALGEDQLAKRVRVVEGRLQGVQVSRAEQLQVVLLFLQACRRDEQYLMLPQVLPRNLQTSILYVKSLEARLGLKEPPADQKAYIIQNLRYCETEKVNINFTWFQNCERMEDRVLEFNLEKEVAEEWMRQLYREAINQRQAGKVADYLQKYRAGKLGLMQMAEMLRYCHGINIWESVCEMGVTLKQDDIFQLLEMIRVPLLVSFDIFALSLDEEISLNYAHICLGLYNISYKEAEGNEVYQLIMDRLMRPYLRTPRSSSTKFKTKYPCFFQKWIYTYHLPDLFLELGGYISEHGANPECAVDAVEKIKLLGQYLGALETRERLLQVMTLDTLTTSLIQFATTLSEDTQPTLTIAAIDLYCLLLTKFLQDSQDISVQFIVNSRLLSSLPFIEEALKHVRNAEPKKAQQPSLLNEMLRQLPDYMNHIGIRRTFQVVSTYFQLVKPEADDEDANVKVLFEAVLSIKPTTFLEFLFQFLVRMRALANVSKIRDNQEAKSGEQRVLAEQEGVLKLLEESQGVLKALKERGECSLEGLNLTEVVFLEDLVRQMNPTRPMAHKGLVGAARRIMKELLQLLSSKDDLMYFAERLDMVQLVLCGGPREEELLVALIIDNRHREVQTELLKRLLRESRKLSDAANRAIDVLSKTPEKVHSYHINRLIQINSRYPSPRIEHFLIANISCERNNSPAKIHQKFLPNDLAKLLQKVPRKLCEELLLKPISAQERDRLIELVSAIFQKLLYLPLSKFEGISLATVEEAGDQEEWNTDSDDEEPPPLPKPPSKEQRDHSQSSGAEEEHPEPQSDQNSSDNFPLEDQDNYYRPDFLEVFTSQDRKEELRHYEALMLVREEIDVLVDSDYANLKDHLRGPQGKLLEDKLAHAANLLNSITEEFAQQIAVRMPQPLYSILSSYGLHVVLSPEVIEKMQKSTKPSTRKPKWLEQFFSDRAESDDSEVSENRGQEYGEDQDEDGYDDDEEYDEDDARQCYDDEDEEDCYEEDNQEEEIIEKKLKNVKPKPKRKREDEELPELLPTYSKIEEEVSGGELKRQEVIKLLEIALYMLLRLPESQVRCRQVSSFYLELLSTSFGQTFIESFFTVLRFDETRRNLEAYAAGLKGECGLQEVSLEDAISNVLFLLRQRQEEEKEGRGNLLFKEAGTLLPIAEEMIARFQLPLQNNCLTLLLIYIATNKARIRSKIAALNFNLQGGQVSEGTKEYKLSSKEISRIIQAICRYRSSNRIWQVVEQTMGLKVKLSTKLLECIRGYGNSLFRKVVQVSKKIAAVVGDGREGQSVEESHLIVSRLVQSCREEIKQFYFINKQTLVQIFTEEGVMPDDCEIKQLPKLLRKLRSQLMGSRELMRLTEAMFYFLRVLREQFFGKIEEKLFQRLIHYPKLLVEVAWYYVYIFREGGAIWTSPAQIGLFFQKYGQFGSFQFRDLQDVFNLVLHFLQLPSFCSNKFKQLLVPVLMRNPTAAHQVGLRFKLPNIDGEMNIQNILVTRKCSFDMAFYQVTGDAIAVQFHEEEGSDHGGLVRELMIGWKGRGVGEEAFFIGKILGISFRQGVPYGGALDIAMFVAITNFTPSIDFFREVDPEIHRSLQYIRDHDPSDLCLRFVVEKLVNGRLRQFQLVEGGANIELTNTNKQRYLSAYCENYFQLGRQQELQKIRAGFNSVVFADYARIFTPQEMLRQIRGQQVIDVKMLVSKARYEGYSEQSPVIKWFWEIVQGFTQELMNTFIHFVTGSPKITVFNCNFNITIEKVYDVNCLPVAHTCFNTLDLPQYSSKEILEKKLMTAICEGNNSFGIL